MTNVVDNNLNEGDLTHREKCLVEAVTHFLSERSELLQELEGCRSHVLDVEASVEYLVNQLTDATLAQENLQNERDSLRRELNEICDYVEVLEAKELDARKAVQKAETRIKGYQFILYALGESTPEVSATGTEDPLRYLYRMASKGTHPDHGGSVEQFAKVTAAYEELLV
jgi:chromosome segregation ATPase